MPEFNEQSKYSDVDIINASSIPPEKFGQFTKSGTTHARRLTQADYDTYNGIIRTLEGHSSFEVGDYLVMGPKGELYPISASVMERTKEIVGEEDESGWADYKTTIVINATQIDHPFAVKRSEKDILYGKPGDMLVYHDGSQWIVDKEIFDITYSPAPTSENQRSEETITNTSS